MEKTDKLCKVLLKPNSQRIIQFLMLKVRATPSEMLLELSDIPRASLYRAVNELCSVSMLKVVSEKKVRAATEKTYALTNNQPQDIANKDVAGIIHSALMNITASFAKYFSDETKDPQKDMLLVSASTVMLTDEEFTEFLSKISKLFAEVIENKPQKNRRARRITLISSPTNKEN